MRVLNKPSIFSFLISNAKCYQIIENQMTESNMEDLYVKLMIEDEEEGGVIIGVEEIQENKETFLLVGRFLTNKNINFQAMYYRSKYR